MISGDIPIHVDEVSSVSELERPYDAVVTLYSFDEPVAELFDAARQVPELNIYVTGNLSKLPQTRISAKPENLYFTIFLSYPEYLGLLRD